MIHQSLGHEICCLGDISRLSYKHRSRSLVDKYQLLEVLVKFRIVYVFCELVGRCPMYFYLTLRLQQRQAYSKVMSKYSTWMIDLNWADSRRAYQIYNFLQTVHNWLAIYRYFHKKLWNPVRFTGHLILRWNS